MVEQVAPTLDKKGPRYSWLVLLGFIVVNCVWGSTFLGIRIAVEVIPPFFMAGTRFLLAGVIMMSISRLSGRRLPTEWSEWRTALLMGILLLAIGNGFVSYAEVYVPSNQAALLIATSALWMAWMGTLGAQGQPLANRAKIGLLIGLLGTAFMFWPEQHLEMQFLGAQLMILVSSICWSAGTIYFRNQSKSLDPFMFAGAQMVCGGLVLLVMSFITKEWPRIEFTPRSLAAWSYLVIFGSCLAFGAYVWLIDKIKSANLAVIAYITPMIATFLGWWILDEQLSKIQFIGMAVIITSIILVTAPMRRVSVRKFY